MMSALLVRAGPTTVIALHLHRVAHVEENAVGCRSPGDGSSTHGAVCEWGDACTAEVVSAWLELDGILPDCPADAAAQVVVFDDAGEGRH